MASSLVFVIVVALAVDEPTGFDPKLTVPGVTFRTSAAVAVAGTTASTARTRTTTARNLRVCLLGFAARPCKLAMRSPKVEKADRPGSDAWISQRESQRWASSYSPFVARLLGRKT
jgi:hypothetical protein